MSRKYQAALAGLILIGAVQNATADVISDWNEKAVTYVLSRSMGPPPAERTIAMMHAAMFDAVNSIERKYRPYLVQLPAPAGTSKEAAAASAAGSILAAVSPQTAANLNAMLAAYLDALPATGKTEGVKLGEAVAAKIIEARANDGANQQESYRANTPPGVYVPTPAVFVPQWPNVKPFVMTSPAQFRAAPPVTLDSPRWAADYNEIKALGRVDSATRSADQTEVARFWLAIGGDVYYPMTRAVAAAKKLDLIDSARLFALVSMARADSLIGVFDSKYHYGFWRPVTAIRNGDRDDNPATERDPTWLPIADTPMHPEYPCAHCVQAASMGAVLEALTGSRSIGEVAMTSTTAPGVTRRWTDLHEFVKEVSQARIWAGFHYRFSTEAAEKMGRQIGEYAVNNALQPVAVAVR